MTRLIDADALSEKLCETTIFIKDGESFQRMINDAPTVADAVQIPIKLEKRYPQSRNEDITDAFMRGYLAGRSSADRPTGEWVKLEREENVYDLHGVPTWGVNYMCDKCGFITTAIQDHFGQYKFCPNCGCWMIQKKEGLNVNE